MHLNGVLRTRLGAVARGNDFILQAGISDDDALFSGIFSQESGGSGHIGLCQSRLRRLLLGGSFLLVGLHFCAYLFLCQARLSAAECIAQARGERIDVHGNGIGLHALAQGQGNTVAQALLGGFQFQRGWRGGFRCLARVRSLLVTCLQRDKAGQGKR